MLTRQGKDTSSPFSCVKSRICKIDWTAVIGHKSKFRSLIESRSSKPLCDMSTENAVVIAVISFIGGERAASKSNLTLPCHCLFAARGAHSFSYPSEGYFKRQG